MHDVGGGRIEAEAGHDGRNHLLFHTLPARSDNGGHGKAFPPTVRRRIRGGQSDVARHREYAKARHGYGARVEVLAKSGRHNVLKAKAEALAQAARMFVVQYGINLDDYGEVLLGAVAEQVQNIPDGLDDLYITCGSGITASGVLVGIEKYGKNVKRVHLISTAYDRQEKVKATLRRFGVTREFIYHDLFHTPGFVYEKQQKMRIGGVKLHPQYEAKTMKYLVEHDLNTENALFWIVGAEPRER